jgi:hypothetical protein
MSLDELIEGLAVPCLGTPYEILIAGSRLGGVTRSMGS